MQTDERRAFVRLPFSVDIACGPVAEAAYDTRGRGQNVSLGGVCAVLLQRYDIGASLRVRFLFPDLDNVVTASGRVIHVKAYTIGQDTAYDTGIEFTDISADGRRAVDQWITSHPMARATVVRSKPFTGRRPGTRVP